MSSPAHTWTRRALLAIGVLLPLLASGVALWLSFSAANGRSGGAAERGQPAPTFALPSLTGDTARLADQEGRVVLLNFWATWCTPCKAEMPELQGLAHDFADAPFAVWAIDFQESAADIAPFQRELGLQFPLLLDREGEVTRAYGVRGLPATFLIDRRGVIRQQRLGPLVQGGPATPWSRAWLTQQVRDLLAE